MRLLKALLIFSHIILGLVLLVLTGALWNPYSPRVKSTKRWWLGRTLRILGVDIEMHGATPEQVGPEGLIYISNHVSWLDIPLIGSLQETCFLSKAEVKNWPLIGRLAQGAGTLFIQRGSGDSNKIARQIANKVNHGHSVLFFPEGTTTDGKSVKAFHKKLFKACQYSHSLICPIVIKYSIENEPTNPVAFIGDDEFMGHLWQLLSYSRIQARVEFLPAFQLYPDNISLQVKSIEQQMRNKVEYQSGKAKAGQNQAGNEPLTA